MSVIFLLDLNGFVDPFEMNQFPALNSKNLKVYLIPRYLRPNNMYTIIY